MAVKMLGAQNMGYRTEVCKILHVREEENGWIVAFALNDPSVESLRTLHPAGRTLLLNVTFRNLILDLGPGFETRDGYKSA